MLARKTTASLTTIVGRRVRFTTLSPPALSLALIKRKLSRRSLSGENCWGTIGKSFLSFSLSRLSRIRDERDDFTRNTHTERKGERKSSIYRDSRSFVLSRRFFKQVYSLTNFLSFSLSLFGGGSLFKTLTKTRARSIKQQQVSAIQQQQRLFSADAVQSTDASSWDTAIAANATEETKRELASLAKTMADIKDAVQRDADRSTEIDFAKFKQQLTNSPEIVDLFQKAYSTLKLPKYESTEIADVTQAFKVLEEAAKKQAAESAKRIEELEKELVALKEERESLERVTMDEIFEREPEMREKFNEQIKKDEWF